MNQKYILITIALVVLVAGGILGYQYWWLPRQEVWVPEEGVEDKTTDWKTYTKEKEYSFGYPLDIDGSSIDMDMGFRSYAFNLPGEELDISLIWYPLTHRERLYGAGPFTEGLKFGVSSQPNEDNETPQSYIEQYKQQFDNPDREGYIDPSQCKENPISVGGYSAIRVTDCPTEFILFKHPAKKLIVIISWTAVGEKAEEYEETFNQILSTFRFLE